MCAFDEYIREIQTAKVRLTSKLKSSFTYNGIGSVEQYEQMIWQKEFEYLKEYVDHMVSPGQEYWKTIYKSYLETSSDYFYINPDHTIQHSQINIISTDFTKIIELPSPMANLIQEYIYYQYNSLNRVKNCIPKNSSLFHFPFRWQGETTELLEYITYPFMAQKILPLDKNATQRLWIEKMFLLLKKPLPKHLYQTIHKLLLREDPLRFIHTLEKNIRQILES